MAGRDVQKAVDDWNNAYPVGTPVRLTRDNGNVVITRTRSEAEVLSGHTAVIWLEGVSGCYCLDKVEPYGESDAA